MKLPERIAEVRPIGVFMTPAVLNTAAMLLGDGLFWQIPVILYLVGVLGVSFQDHVIVDNGPVILRRINTSNLAEGSVEVASPNVRRGSILRSLSCMGLICFIAIVPFYKFSLGMPWIDLAIAMVEYIFATASLVALWGLGIFAMSQASLTKLWKRNLYNDF